MNLEGLNSTQQIHVFKEGDIQMTNKPTTIRLSDEIKKLIQFLQETNKGKMGAPSISQVIGYAIQLAAVEQLNTMKEDKHSWYGCNEVFLSVFCPGLTITSDEVKASITNTELKNRILKEEPKLDNEPLKQIDNNPFAPFEINLPDSD